MMDWRHLQAWALCQAAKVLSRFGEAHVWLVFHMDLRRPVVPISASVPVAIGQAAVEDVAEMAALSSADEPGQHSPNHEEEVFRARLRAGSVCLVARIEGRIVAYDWIRPRCAAGPAGVMMVLADDEVYTTDAYTAAAWRGRRIHPALNHAILRRAQDDGYRIAYTMARADNSRSLPTLRRLGWTLGGAMLVHGSRHEPDEQRWLVLGSPYPMPVGPLASTRVFSLAEFHAQQGFDAQEVLPAQPFAHHCRLRRGRERCRLTIVPAEHAAGLRVAVAVATAWPAVAWQVVACNAAFESWLLTREPDEASMTSEPGPAAMRALLGSYAALQAAAARDPERLRGLPVAPMEGLVERVLAFLERDADQDETGSAEVGATFFLGSGQAARWHQALLPHCQALTHHLQLCSRLPVTLNHGDLQLPDAAVSAAGVCCMPDWSWASAGPAGLSLHGLVAAGALAEARGPSGVDHAFGTGALMDHYRAALVQRGYASEAVLGTALPAALIAGVLLDVLRMARYPMEDPASRAAIAERLQSRFEALLQACRRLPAAERASDIGPP